MRIRKLARNNSGQALVETALVLPHSSRIGQQRQ